MLLLQLLSFGILPLGSSWRHRRSINESRTDFATDLAVLHPQDLIEAPLRLDLCSRFCHGMNRAPQLQDTKTSVARRGEKVGEGWYHYPFF